mmetsp:Transcript_69997/g.161912  ORF Transcript_69997/g.161912 Transcript_69997/m.161912 type:complete len:266 (+) Transcript_69997:708-1505(+)
MSSMEPSLLSFTKRPSLVHGVHSFSSAPLPLPLPLPLAFSSFACLFARLSALVTWAGPLGLERPLFSSGRAPDSRSLFRWRWPMYGSSFCSSPESPSRGSSGALFFLIIPLLVASPLPLSLLALPASGFASIAFFLAVFLLVALPLSSSGFLPVRMASNSAAFLASSSAAFLASRKRFLAFAAFFSSVFLFGPLFSFMTATALEGPELLFSSALRAANLAFQSNRLLCFLLISFVATPGRRAFISASSSAAFFAAFSSFRALARL